MATEAASDVVALFHTRMDAITSETPTAGFQASAYRLTLDKEPDSAVDGLYFVDCNRSGGQGPHYGNTESIYTLGILIEVAYFRGGGDMGGGDRQTVMRNALDDIQRITDIVCAPSGYDQANTGVRRILRAGEAVRVIDKPHYEVWSIPFEAEWRSDLITT